MTEKLTTHDRPPQFSIASILGAMVVIGAVLAVFRLSIVGGSAFAAIVLPALGRAYWAETLRKRAGDRGAPGDAVGTYFVSLAIVTVIGVLSCAAGCAGYVAADLFTDWRNPGHGPAVIAILMAGMMFLGLFWLTRPRTQHYLP